MTERTDRPTVALLGTGTMGAGMARNITAADLPLRVWNRTRAKAEPLAEAGAHVADSPADAVRGADLVVTMLFDTEAVESAMADARDGLGPEAVWVQQSTVGVEGSARLAGLADDLGLPFVDAPVLGTKKPAEDGALVVLASGPQDVRDRVEPLFDAVGSRTQWVGEGQEATRLKLVANAWVLSVLEGIAETLKLAEALDLDPQLFLDAVKGGAMDAPYVQLKGSAMLSGSFDPAFAVAGAAKDAALMRDAAAAAGVEVPIVEIAQRYLDLAKDKGHGDDDMAATYLVH
jgi:3-hydroxyisobutyrate dehydrogenase